jgi:hypothetical protein
MCGWSFELVSRDWTNPSGTCGASVVDVSSFNSAGAVEVQNQGVCMAIW